MGELDSGLFLPATALPHASAGTHWANDKPTCDPSSVSTPACRDIELSCARPSAYNPFTVKRRPARKPVGRGLVRALVRSLISLLEFVLALALCGCEAFLFAQGPPATWAPLPTIGPTATHTPAPTSTGTAPDLPRPIARSATPTHTATWCLEGHPSLHDCLAITAAWARDAAWSDLVHEFFDRRLPADDPRWSTGEASSDPGVTTYHYQAGAWGAQVDVPVTVSERRV